MLGSCEICFVSIPHRYATNSLTFQLKFVINEVSIPHRYATNKIQEHWERFIVALFQSLIGTLQTFNQTSEVLSVSKFQSLIGTLQTRPTEGKFPGLRRFQSLIGTLQTFGQSESFFTAIQGFNPS